MRASEIRDMPTSDIVNKLDASRREMWNLRMAFHTNTLEDPNQIRLLRKDMARMFTILRERELATAHLLAEQAAGQTVNPGTVTVNEEEKGADHGK